MVKTGEYLWWPSVSPDGRKIAYSTGLDVAASGTIHVVTVSTGATTEVAALARLQRGTSSGDAIRRMPANSSDAPITTTATFMVRRSLVGRPFHEHFARPLEPAPMD